MIKSSRGNRMVGKQGERAALKFLKDSGYKILETNFRTPLGEIDIVAKKGAFRVFVEVKARTSLSLGPPYLAVTRAKEKHIVKSALFYLKRCGLDDSCWRIDIVSVQLDYRNNVEKIELFENAVEDDSGV